MMAIQGIAEAGSGHPGASFSAAEIMGSLYFHKMNHKPDMPDWEDRDYFINSKAHFCAWILCDFCSCWIYPL
jgi:transketolase